MTGYQHFITSISLGFLFCSSLAPAQSLPVRRAVYLTHYGPVAEKPTGYATWYGAALHGRITSSGERFNMYKLTAAHRTLPFGTLVEVTNLLNKQRVVVRITDRCPDNGERIIDLAWAAAQRIDAVKLGVVPIRLTVLSVPQRTD